MNISNAVFEKTARSKEEKQVLYWKGNGMEMNLDCFILFEKEIRAGISRFKDIVIQVFIKIIV